jgi:DNA-binding NarL/FixJ family response regulator
MNNLLTKRQPVVLMFTMEGPGSKEVADRLCISPRTVETHCSNIFEKPEAHNKTAVVYKARLLNILRKQTV